MTEGTAGPDPIALLAKHFDDLSAALTAAAHGDPMACTHVVQFAAGAIPNAQHCSITRLGRAGRAQTVAATGPVAQLVDELQYATNQGPCITAVSPGAEGGEVLAAPDLHDEPRWPEFARRCVEATPVRSLLVARLPLRATGWGALSLHAEFAHAFGPIDVTMAAIFAPFAALTLQAMSFDDEVANLQDALSSSRQIGVAMGILMARGLITRDAAFEQLSTASQTLNRKLRDIAAEVELAGELPPLGAPADRPTQ